MRIINLLAIIGFSTAIALQDAHPETRNRESGDILMPIDKARFHSETPRNAEIESKREQVLETMEAIRIPEVDFRQADIRDVVKFLFDAANEFDPKKRGISIILKLDSSNEPREDGSFFSVPAASTNRSSQTLVTFSALDITLKEALDYSVDIAGLKYIIRAGSIMILDRDTVLDEEIIRRVYAIDPLRFSEELPPDPNSVGNIELQSLSQLKKLFSELGGSWPAKSSIHYLHGPDELRVANTEANMEIFDRIMANLKIQRYQLEFEVHFVAFDSSVITALGPNGITAEALTALRSEGQGELLAAPRVLTQTGQSATIKGVTECIYPSEFRVHTAGTNTNSTATAYAVEPAHFMTREIGPILEVTAEAQPNGNLINIGLSVELVESPVWHQFGGTFTDAQGDTQQANMPQPHFHTYKGTLNVLVTSGKTVLIGGGVPSRDGKRLVYMFLTGRMVGMQGERLWEE